MRARSARLLALAATLASGSASGCGAASEAASLRLAVDGEGAAIGFYGASSATGVDVELEWAMAVENHGEQGCPVAVYRWDQAVEPGATLPTVADTRLESWPESWPETGEAELITSGVVEPGQTLVFGPEPLSSAGEAVEARLALAVCPSAELELDVRAEVFADLGVRSAIEALNIELWRIF